MEKTGKKKKVSVMIPCYNEEAVLGETSKRLREKYDALIGAGLISPDSRVVFVNDGSKDKTWEIISALHDEAPEYFSGINLAHNAGHQNAVLAGLMTVKDLCDMATVRRTRFSRNSRRNPSIS